MMRKGSAWFWTGAAAGLLLTFSSLYADRPQLDLSLYSSYIWRGFDLNPNSRPALQPSLTVPLGSKGLSLNVWASFSFVDRDLDELDFTLAWCFRAGKHLSITVGAVQFGWYFSRNFSWKANTSREFFVTLEAENQGLRPTFSLFWDVANGSGLYALLGVAHSSDLCCGRSLELSASLGYNHRQWITGSGFSNLNLSLSMPKRNSRVSITPSAHLSVILLDEVNPGTDLEVWGGLSITWDT